MRGGKIQKGWIKNPRRYEFTEILITSTVFIALKFIKHRVFLLSGICIVVMRSAWDGETASSILAFPTMVLWLQTQTIRLSKGIAEEMIKRVKSGGGE